MRAHKVLPHATLTVSLSRARRRVLWAAAGHGGPPELHARARRLPHPQDPAVRPGAGDAAVPRAARAGELGLPRRLRQGGAAAGAPRRGAPDHADWRVCTLTRLLKCADWRVGSPTAARTRGCAAVLPACAAGLCCSRSRRPRVPVRSVTRACPPCLEQGMCCSGVCWRVCTAGVSNPTSVDSAPGSSCLAAAWVPRFGSVRPLCGRASGWHRRPLLLSAAPSVCPRARAQVRMIRAELGRRWRARWGLDSGWSAGGSPAAGAPATAQRAAVPS